MVHPDDRNYAVSAFDKERRAPRHRHTSPEAYELLDQAEARLAVLVDEFAEWADFVHAHRGELSERTRRALLDLAD